MKTFVGIDLGSTTTKAVILDEDRKVIGRGITNSRSNYATAARVASQEAYVDGQFTLFRRALTTRTRRSISTAFLGALERAFRLEQFLEQLDDLEADLRRPDPGRALRQGRVRREGFARRGVPAAARGGARTLRARRQAQIRLLPRYRGVALPHPCRRSGARGEPALRSAAQRLRQINHRGGKPAAGRRAERQIPARARHAC